MYAMAMLAKSPNLGAEKLENGGPMDEGKAKDSAVGEPVLPAIFRDPGYAQLAHSTLSTSNCGNPCLRLFGFGAVVPDGFGIGYIIKDDAISICASSKHLQTQRFLDTLRAYLLEVQRMLQQLYREANAKPAVSVSPLTQRSRICLTLSLSRSRTKRRKMLPTADTASMKAHSAL
jgi:carnitine O-acetyltransferase